MRKTLNSDNDVVGLIQKVLKATNASLTEVVNSALRDGLIRRLEPPAPRMQFRTGVHFPGKCYLLNLDNTAEILAIAEGESFK